MVRAYRLFLMEGPLPEPLPLDLSSPLVIELDAAEDREWFAGKGPQDLEFIVGFRGRRHIKGVLKPFTSGLLIRKSSRKKSGRLGASLHDAF